MQFRYHILQGSWQTRNFSKENYQDNEWLYIISHGEETWRNWEELTSRNRKERLEVHCRKGVRHILSDPERYSQNQWVEVSKTLINLKSERNLVTMGALQRNSNREQWALSDVVSFISLLTPLPGETCALGKALGKVNAFCESVNLNSVIQPFLTEISAWYLSAYVPSIHQPPFT